MQVWISTGTLSAITAHAAADPAREVCGLLFGDDRHILAAAPTANVSALPQRHFELDPQALFAAIRAERHGGPCLIGHYHSHPSGSTDPSPCDAAAAEPGRLWLIVAAGRVGAWRAVPGGPLHGAFAAVALAVSA